MWLNKYEEKTMGPFLDFVHLHRGDTFCFSMADAAQIEVELYLLEYESDNGLDLSDEGYEELWSVSFKIVRVVKDETNHYFEGEIIDIDYHTVPLEYSTK